jgi:hypothetical protein
MSACPSRLELSRWEAYPEAERPVELTSHVGQCGRCAEVFADIASARSSLFGSDPAAASARAARAILATVEAWRERRRWLRFLAPALLVPAAAALLFVARPGVRSHAGGDHSAVVAKGGFVLETYCKRGEQVFPASDGQDVLAGDRLRFAYTMDRPGFLLIFGVDDGGKIFPYYQENALVPVRVEAGARILLPDAIEMDGHTGWERIYAVRSDAQLGDDNVRAAVATALSAAGSDIRRATSLDLPGDQVSMLLRRP